MMIMMVFCITINFSSCSKDDNETASSSSSVTSNSKDWYFYEDKDAFNNAQANSDYNSNRLNYYNYVNEDGIIKRGYGRTCIRFVNKNTLEYWYFTLCVAGCKESLSSQYYCNTPYYLGKDKFIYYSSSHSTYSYVEIDGKIIVSNGDIYTRMSNGIVKDGTSQVMTQGAVYTSNFSKEKQIADACKSVKVNASCNYNNLTCTVTFNNSLSSQYPSDTFVFGVEYGINSYDTTIESETKSNPVSISFAMLDQEKSPYFSIALKIQNNVPLNSSEKSFYNKWYRTIQDMISKGVKFVSKYYVRYGGVKYYIEGETSIVQGNQGNINDNPSEENNSNENSGDFTYSGAINGHNFVDLGLSVKWATCNIGATSPEEFGDYFAWGETVPSATNKYAWDTYKWCDGTSRTMTKYCLHSSNGPVDNKSTISLEDDAAHVNWGGVWRMPTKGDLEELRENCTWTWTTYKGQDGFTVTSKINGKKIFIPDSGRRYDGKKYIQKRASSYSGYYTSSIWSSRLSTEYDNHAYCLEFHYTESSNGEKENSIFCREKERCYGMPIRAVCP